MALTEGETHSFIYTVEEPSDGRAYIYYCWPMADGSDPTQRMYFKISLGMPAYSPGERPFWAKLLTRSLEANYLYRSNSDFGQGNFNRINNERIFEYYLLHPDTIVLYLDRDVEIRDIVPEYFNGRRVQERYKPDIIIRRIQFKEQIVQFGYEGGIDIMSQISVERKSLDRNWMVQPLTLADANPVQIAAGDAISGHRELIFTQEPTPKGGKKLTFMDYWSTGSGRNKRSKSKTIVIVILEPGDYKSMVAWVVKMDWRLSNGKYPVKIVFSSNINIRVKKDVSILWNNNDSELPFIKLYFHKVEEGNIIRPNERFRYRFKTFSQARRLYRIPVEDLVQDHGIQFLVDLVLGSIPIIGDILDLGEFLYSLIARRDRWGNELENWEILAMGIGAMIPGVSAHIGRMRALGNNGGRYRVLMEEVRDIDNLSQLKDFHRLNLLPHVVINDLTDEQLGALLNSISKNFSMTGARDLKLSRLLDY